MTNRNMAPESYAHLDANDAPKENHDKNNAKKQTNEGIVDEKIIKDPTARKTTAYMAKR